MNIVNFSHFYNKLPIDLIVLSLIHIMTKHAKHKCSKMHNFNMIVLIKLNEK